MLESRRLYVVGICLAGACSPGDPVRSDAGPDSGAGSGSDAGALGWQACSIDVHQHLTGVVSADSADALIARMDDLGIDRAFLLPPPAASGTSLGAHYDYAELAPVVAANSDRLGLIGGGGILNEQIHAAHVSGEPVSDAMLDDFEDQVRTVLDNGVVGIGEMAVLHLSYTETHPFIEIAADHPYMLRLADVAAIEDVPIDIHLELTVEVTTPPQPYFAIEPDGNNPPTLLDNNDPFGVLLAHNPDARIVWSHVGWDNIGEMTVNVLSSMLDAHPNLYLSLKILDEPSGVQFIENRPLDETGLLRDEWRMLIELHPERFVLGSDEFFGGAGMKSPGSASTQGTWSILAQLDAEVAYQIACENPRRIYRF